MSERLSEMGRRSGEGAAGHYTSPRDSTRFYRRLGREIDAARDRREISCLPDRATLAPPFRWSYVGDAFRVAPRELLLTLDLGDEEFGDPPSVGTEQALVTFRNEVGPISPEAVALSPDGDTSDAAIRRSMDQAAAAPLHPAGSRVVADAVGRLTTCLAPLTKLLFLAALFGLALRFGRRFRIASGSAIALLALGSLVALLTRVALLSYIDVTAIPSINTLYSSPATPFAIVFAVLGTAMVADEIARAVRKQRGAPLPVRVQAGFQRNGSAATGPDASLPAGSEETDTAEAAATLRSTR